MQLVSNISEKIHFSSGFSAVFAYLRYDNTSNYGKKNEVIESCPEFNAEQHFIIPFFR